MDADTAPVAEQAFIAACKGQTWVDETYGIGTEKHGFYTGTLTGRQPTTQAYSPRHVR
jgi:hypothetical protein